MSEPESVAEPEPTPESVAEPEPTPEPVAEPEPTPEPVAEPAPESVAEPAPESVAEPAPESVAEPAPESVAEPEPVNGNSHLFAIRTTGGQEKIVIRLLEARMKLDQKDEEEIEKAKEEGREIKIDPTFPRVKNVQSILLLSDLKGYVVLEAQDASAMFNAIQGIRHVRGQLRGELTYNEIDKYLIKKSTVSELAIDNTVEIIAGPFKGMKATITKLDQEKEEATVVLLDASYQLPVTVDANYLKLAPV